MPENIAESTKAGLHRSASGCISGFLCPEVKPPSYGEQPRHNAVFSKILDFRGGLTSVPKGKMQPSKHGDLSDKHGPSFHLRHES